MSPELRSQLEIDSPHDKETWLSMEEADALREQVQDLLQVEGFDENYEPNVSGRVLETLVDKLFTG